MIYVDVPENLFGIPPGLTAVSDLAVYLRDNARNPQAIIFIASLLES